MVTTCLHSDMRSPDDYLPFQIDGVLVRQQAAVPPCSFPDQSQLPSSSPLLLSPFSFCQTRGKEEEGDKELDLFQFGWSADAAAAASLDAASVMRCEQQLKAEGQIASELSFLSALEATVFQDESQNDKEGTGGNRKRAKVDKKQLVLASIFRNWFQWAIYRTTGKKLDPCSIKVKVPQGVQAALCYCNTVGPFYVQEDGHCCIPIAGTQGAQVQRLSLAWMTDFHGQIGTLFMMENTQTLTHSSMGGPIFFCGGAKGKAVQGSVKSPIPGFTSSCLATKKKKKKFYRLHNRLAKSVNGCLCGEQQWRYCPTSTGFPKAMALHFNKMMVAEISWKLGVRWRTPSF